MIFPEFFVKVSLDFKGSNDKFLEKFHRLLMYSICAKSLTLLFRFHNLILEGEFRSFVIFHFWEFMRKRKRDVISMCVCSWFNAWRFTRGWHLHPMKGEWNMTYFLWEFVRCFVRNILGRVDIWMRNLVTWREITYQKITNVKICVMKSS